MQQFENIEVYQNGRLIDSKIINYTSEELVQREIEKYKSRKTDGEKTFLEFAGEIRVKKLLGVITEEEFANLEQVMFPVRTEITLGQWKSALIILEQIDSSLINQDVFNKIHTTITDYILNNY